MGRFVLRGFAAGMAMALLAFVFMAYLEPSVYLSAAGLLALCK